MIYNKDFLVVRDTVKIILYYNYYINRDLYYYQYICCRAAFILRNPKSRRSFEIFFKPLSVDVWMSIIVCSILCVLAQKIGFTEDNKSARIANDVSWSFSTICTFGAFCQQEDIKIFEDRIATLLLSIILKMSHLSLPGVLEALHNNCAFSNTVYLIVPKTTPRKRLHFYHVCNMNRMLEHIKSLIFRIPLQIEQQLINRTREAAQNMSSD
ncbi:hypothetical protein D910_01939 [Dendroctonus ponderosae]|uniref:Uncharacterized protein n=1 Tax=Dendroctonus ponderosae TaxID=77166 RepID=U4TSL8_DENPD|nr:hypothetical protein D910_01939 [Dendroctonus ponderosae]